MPKEARSAVATPALQDFIDSHSDVDTGSQVDDDEDEDSFLPEQTPPAQESISSKSSTIPPLKRFRSSPSTYERPSTLLEDNAESPAAASKSAALLDGASQQHTSQSREQSPTASPSPVQNSCAEPRSDDDDVTATGCCLLDLWAAAAPAADEPAVNPASSSSLTAPKLFDAVSQELSAPLLPKPAPILQLALPLKLSPRQQPSHANSKRPRVSITLGSIPAAPKQRTNCSRPPVPSRHAAMVYRPSVCRKRIATPCFDPSAQTLDAAPHQASTSHHVLATDLTAWSPPTGLQNAASPPLQGSSAGTPVGRASPGPATEPLSPDPPDDLPMSVQMDRDIINTMLVMRRTSSR